MRGSPERRGDSPAHWRRDDVIRLRHVLVTDGPRTVPGWYVVDTGRRPAVTLAGPFNGRDDAAAALATLRGRHG